ncbi:acyl-CoA dehydrogenase family protein [Rothia nasimurium]|uniref:acyl-CoA dehydrogenase family protein n=1 Tax=Rothia nasimurium TaxID=85336 RepID=UPI003BA09335
MTLSFITPLGAPARPNHHDRWIKVAEEVADQLRQDVVARDRAGRPPEAEKDLLKKSGLLPLNIPARWGGEGLNWNQCFELVQIIARADNSIGQLLGYHYVFQVFPYLDLEEQRAEKLARDTLANHWLFASTGTPQGQQIQAQAVDGGWSFTGVKPFATGSYVADKIFSRAFTEDGRRVVALVDTRSDGFVRHDDWDVVGSRLTATNSLEYRQVFVPEEDVIAILPATDADREPHKNLSTPAFQLLFSTVYLAAAEGALQEALGYTRSSSRPWFHATVEKATDDPYILAQYGEFAAQVQALSAVVQQATDALDWGLAQGQALTAAERAHIAEQIVTAKITAHTTALAVTQGVFDVTGARATKRSVGLDRHWRDVRTHTLHDPVAYKKAELGAYLLTGQEPSPSPYR